MAHGLQIFDAAGNLVLDTSTFVLKDINVFSDSAVVTPQTISLSGVSSDAVVFIANNEPPGAGAKPLPNATLSGSNLIITSSAAFNAQIRIMDYF